MSKYNKFYSIMSAIKRCFSRSPNHREALKSAKCPRKKGPRGGARYACASCKKDFGLREVNVDHVNPIVPIGTLSKDMSWDTIVERIFCEPENLQVLCSKCHTKKSQKENRERKKIKDELSGKGTTDSKRVPAKRGRPKKGDARSSTVDSGRVESSSTGSSEEIKAGTKGETE